MCETTLLYLGNNLYGILQRKPFTLDHPLKFDLGDMQRMQLLFTDAATYCMYFEIHKSSDFEQLLRDDEIFEVEEPKPELLLHTHVPDILHPDYLPKGVTIKQEPLDTTSQVISEIISQPAAVARDIKQELLDSASVARDIKQELLDSATQAIVQKHSSTCQINQFIQEHRTVGLRIEDVRMFITADDHATKELSKQVPPAVDKTDDITLPVVMPHTPLKSSDIPARPLLMVTTSPNTNTPEADVSLPVVTAPATHSTLHMVTPTQSNAPVPETTIEHSTDAALGTTQWSRITNKPLEKEPETQHTDVESRYYEVMNPEEDEIYSFSHQDIIARKCKVSLENLTSKDIDNIKEYLKPTAPGSVSGSSSTTPDADSELVKKSRKVSHRPRKQPSKARIHAQKLIRERNKKIVSKKIPMMKVKVTLTTQRKPKQVQPLHRENLDEANADSEDTVIYTPPPTPKPKKPVAKFIFRTLGIKVHRDTAAVEELKKQCTHKFKCYLCKQVYSTTKALNKHFKLEHGGLDCEECGKGFSSPLSLKKHSYMHKLCSHPCRHCDKKFPFKSQ